VIQETCEGIEERYEIKFIEIGTDKDHVHFLIQSVPMYSPSRITRVIKSITAREVFRRVGEVKEQLWGGEFWSKGYYMSTVGQHGNEESIREYVKRQGREKEYQVIRKGDLALFPDFGI
jgi:REP element-mobilizing transposase RayT